MEGVKEATKQRILVRIVSFPAYVLETCFPFPFHSFQHTFTNMNSLDLQLFEMDTTLFTDGAAARRQV